MSVYRFGVPGSSATNRYLFGDVDLLAIWSILSAGWFIIVPLLGWSSTLRKLNARPVLVYWSFLVAIGVLCAIFKLSGNNFNGFSRYWEGAAVICSSVSGDDPSKPPYEHRARPYHASFQAWNHYNCTTQCGSLSPNLVMRPGTQMVPITQPEFANWARPPELYAKVCMGQLSLFLLPAVILQYVYTLWSDRRTPAEARDRVCALIAGRNIRPYPTLRRILAVVLAIFVYVHALLMLIVCPLLFFFNILFNEWFAAYTAQEEPVSAVGQWSPVVNCSLVVIGVSLARLHMRSPDIKRELLWYVRRLLFSNHNSSDQTPSSLERSDKDRKILLISPDRQLTRTNADKLPRSRILIRRLLRYCGEPLVQTLESSRGEWQDFRRWIREPIASSLLRNTQGYVRTKPLSQRPLIPPNAQWICLDQKGTSLKTLTGNAANLSASGSFGRERSHSL